MGGGETNESFKGSDSDGLSLVGLVDTIVLVVSEFGPILGDQITCFFRQLWLH